MVHNTGTYLTFWTFRFTQYSNLSVGCSGLNIGISSFFAYILVRFYKFHNNFCREGVVSWGSIVVETGSEPGIQLGDQLHYSAPWTSYICSTLSNGSIDSSILLI